MIWQRAWRWVRWGVTIGALLLIVASINLADVAQVLQAAHYSRILLAVGLAALQFGVGAWRWQQLLAVVGAVKPPWRLLFRSYLRSFFVSNLLPGTVTGDVVRIYDTRQVGESSATAALVVLIERALGLTFLGGLGIIAGFTLPAWPAFQLRSEVGLWIIGALGLMGVVFWIGLKRRLASVSRLVTWLKRLVSEAGRVPGQALRRPGQAGAIIAATVVFQLLALLIVYEAFQAVGVEVPLALFVAVAALITVLLILPISIQGIGVRESLYLALLVPFGVKADRIAAGLVLTYLIGLPFIVWGWALFNERPDEVKKSDAGLR